MKKFIALLLATLLIASVFVLMSFSTSALGGTYTAAKAASAPTVDGKLDDCYKSGTKITFKQSKDNDNTKNDSYIYMCHAGGNLYLYGYIKDTDGKRGTANFGATDEDWADKSYLTDCFEVYLDLMPSDQSVNGCDRKQYSAQLRVNPWYTVEKLTVDKHEYANKLGLALNKADGPITELLGVAAGKSFVKVVPDGNSYAFEMKINVEGTAEDAIGVGFQIQEGEQATAKDPVLRKWETQLDDYGDNPKYWSTNIYETMNLPGFQSNATIAAAKEAASKAASDAAAAKAKADSDLAASKAASKAASDAAKAESAAAKTSDAAESNGTASEATATGSQGTPTQAGTASDAGDGTAAQVTAENETASGGSLWLIVGIVAGVLVLAGAAVAVVLVLKKKKAPGDAE